MEETNYNESFAMFPSETIMADKEQILWIDGVNFTSVFDNISGKSHNFSGNDSSSELPLDMQFNSGHLMAIIMYLTLMIISAIGNIYMVCSIIRIRRKSGKLGRINMLLFNLAIADLAVTFLMMPLEIVWSVTVSWHAGDLLCRILSFFRIFGLYLSSFVLICICLDRYFAVITPFAVCDTESRVKKMIAVSWIASIICSLPQSFIFHVERHPKFEWYEQCVTFNSFSSREYEVAYGMFGFCLMYALPMLTIIYCYGRIFCEINHVAEININESQNELRRSDSTFLQRAKMKTLKMTVITAVVFCICWTPYNIICLWHWFHQDSAVKLDQKLQKVFFVFACTNSCVNPLIYGWYHVSGGPKPSADGAQKRRIHLATVRRN